MDGAHGRFMPIPNKSLSVVAFPINLLRECKGRGLKNLHVERCKGQV